MPGELLALKIEEIKAFGRETERRKGDGDDG